MAKNSVINIRTDSETKQAIEQLYSQFGITVSDAVNIFFRKSLMDGGLPFEMKQTRYNKETEEAMLEANNIANGTIKAAPQSVNDFFDEMGL